MRYVIINTFVFFCFFLLFLSLSLDSIIFCYGAGSLQFARGESFDCYNGVIFNRQASRINMT